MGVGFFGDLVCSILFLSLGNICYLRCDNFIVFVKLVIRCINGVLFDECVFVVLGILERGEFFLFFWYG